MNVYIPVHTFEKVLCSLDREKETGKLCLCIPVMTDFCQYAEHYELTAEEFEALASDMAALEAFALRCRERKCDERLMEAPPPDRGRPCRLDAWEGRGLIQSCTTVDNLHEYRTMYIFEPRFSLEYDLKTGAYILDISVTMSPHFDGSERYELSEEEFVKVVHDRDTLLSWVEKCCAHENDHRLIPPIPQRRGDPVYLEWKHIHGKNVLR